MNMRRMMSDAEREDRRYLSQKRYRMKHADRLLEVQRRNRKRRMQNPEYAERERARSREYYASHREQCLERARRWRSKNKDRMHEYQQAVKSTDAYRRKIARQSELRREKRKDPAFRAQISAQQRAYRRKLHAEGRYSEFSRKTYLMKKWEKIVAAGREAIATYVRRARPENRKSFVAWYNRKLIDRTSGLGRITPAEDETC